MLHQGELHCNAYYDGRVLVICLTNGSGKAKVTYFDNSSFGYEYILWLDVSVNHLKVRIRSVKYRIGCVK